MGIESDIENAADAAGTGIKTAAEDVASAVKSKLSVFSGALIAVLQAELPQLEGEAIAYLEQLVVATANQIETDMTSALGTAKAGSFLAQIPAILKAVASTIASAGETVAGAALSTTVQNALVEAGATAVKAGIVAAIGAL